MQSESTSPSTERAESRIVEAPESMREVGERIVEQLKTVYDPEIPVDIYELGLVYEVSVDEQGAATIRMTLTSPMCPAAEELPPEVESKARGVEGVTAVTLDLVWDPAWSPAHDVRGREARARDAVAASEATRPLQLAFFAVSFAAFGVVLVLPGAHQAELARAQGLDLARTGLIASALAAGIGVGVVGAGPLFDRMRRRPLFVVSLAIAAAGLLTVRAEMSFARWLAHMALVGVGIGAYDTLINASVVERYHERAARPMSLIHALATVGAMAGPMLAAALGARDWIRSFHALGVAHLLLAAWAAFIAFPVPPAHAEHARAAGAAARPRAFGAVALAVLPFAAVAFAYVGVEASVTMFAVPYASGALALPEARGGTAISAFWLGLLLGRVGILALPFALSARSLLAAGLLAAGVLSAGVAAQIGVVEATFLATGTALGCVYPLMVALAGQRVPEARGTAAGLAAGAGALGGTAVPWLTGIVGDSAGVAAGVGSLAVWCLMIAVSGALARPVR